MNVKKVHTGVADTGWYAVSQAVDIEVYGVATTNLPLYAASAWDSVEDLSEAVWWSVVEEVWLVVSDKVKKEANERSKSKGLRVGY